MDTRNEMAERVKRLSDDMRDLKSNQTIGGDSWRMYRYEIQYTKTNGSVNKVTFIPEIAGEFVAIAMTYFPGAGSPFMQDQDVTPDPNINGVWWDCSYAFNPVARTMVIWSTKKGTATMENYTRPITA